MEQRLIDVSKNLLGYMDAFLLKAVKSKNTVRDSFRGSIASLGYKLYSRRKLLQFLSPSTTPGVRH